MRPLCQVLAFSLLTLLCVNASSAEEKELFNGKDLTGFKQAKGVWKVVDGAIVNDLDDKNNSRLESEASFGNFELSCKLQLEHKRHCELQVHNYGQVFTLGLEKGKWVEVKIVANGAEVKVTADGAAVEMDKGEGKPDAQQGALGFYAPKGGILKIKDVKITTK